MYPRKFINEEYLKPIDIRIESIRFFDLKNIESTEFHDLVNLYRSIYNSDNKKLISEFSFKGSTEENGIWPEDPWDVKNTKELLKSFISDPNTIAIYATAKDIENNNIVIGLSAYKNTTKEDFKSRGYSNPFKDAVLDTIPLYYVMETFKRKINSENGDPIRYFSLELKKKVNEEICKKVKKALIFSSTNNKYMLNLFKKEGRTIVEKLENEWGKYQGYLYLNCDSKF